MMLNQEGGLVTNEDEEMVREWKWPRDGKLAQPVIAQVTFEALPFFTVVLTFCFLLPHPLVSLRCANCKEHRTYISPSLTGFKLNNFPNNLYTNSLFLKSYCSFR